MTGTSILKHTVAELDSLADRVRQGEALPDHLRALVFDVQLALHRFSHAAMDGEGQHLTGAREVE